MLPQSGTSQPKFVGLGQYQIATTTPDSLNKTDFSEGGQTYVKGTLALECPHIRTFLAAKTIVEDIAITNLVLCFFDEKLFAISCDYSDALQNMFQKQYGLGTHKKTMNHQLCSQPGSESMALWGEFWQNADIMAFAIHAKGITNDCTYRATNSLIIISQTMSALSSECNLQEQLPFAETFTKTIK
ncbi:hypothetical protein WBJ53_01935 [Spirosoma sp. SC4-14]|uniref:hypothetical protein n=1 Tax=Spirosoma sp. SC4-14 TaxID=3128900 RepID=UPI0030CC3065